MIVVTGANGRLGRLVVAGLLSRISASEVVAAVRSPERAADLGVAVREADYIRPETLAAALAGAKKVLLISGSEVGRRVPQHTAVTGAAKQAGVALLAYTSAPQADTTGLHVAAEHKVTEQVIRASGVPFAFLRNGSYSENYTATIKQAAETGSFYGSADGGRVASAPISDYAAAAVEVLARTGHEGAVYELSGDVAWSHDDLASEVSAVTCRLVTYQDLGAQGSAARCRAARGSRRPGPRRGRVYRRRVPRRYIGSAANAARPPHRRSATPSPRSSPEAAHQAVPALHEEAGPLGHRRRACGSWTCRAGRRRGPHPSGRRGRLVFLTGRGQAVQSVAIAAGQQVEARWVGLIGGGDLDTIKGLLRELVTKLREA